jgi:hypothetical protein
VLPPSDDTARADTSLFAPFPGPQVAAYESQADELFFGGAAGGGKSFLLLGLALTAHRQSIIFRREHVQVKALEEESRKMLSGTAARYNGQDHFWRGIPGDRMLEFGGVPYEWNVDRYQGRPHDLLGFDEITTFTEYQYRFLSAWNRTTIPDQRCRIVATGNPPVDSEGEWVIRYWAPWLDPQHPNPAKPGELRWFARIGDKDVEVPDATPIEHDGKRITPRSRTFIPARVEDNPLHMATGYDVVLDSLPEPLRSALREGNFNAVRIDDPWQVIPTAWAQAAMKRWEQSEPPDLKMIAVGCDIARGGKDKTAIAPRRGNWFEEIRTYPGLQTPDGASAARYIAEAVEDDAEVVIDAIGIGAAALDAAQALGLRVTAFNAGAASTGKDKSGRYGFANQRAEMYWRFREGLDPASGEDIALPNDRELLADLCAARFKVVGAKYQIEPKDDIKARIGRSPDKGDAVVMGWHGGTYNPGRGIL